MISFNQMATEPSDALVREAQQCSVTALEWNKHRLFSGFSSGKVLMTTVKLNKVTIDVIQQQVSVSFDIIIPVLLFVYTRTLKDSIYYMLQSYHGLSFVIREVYMYQIIIWHM